MNERNKTRPSNEQKIDLSLNNVKRDGGKVEIFSYSQVIYIMRNPKDRLVSYFHFRKKMPPNKELDALFGVEWNDFFNSYMMGKYTKYIRMNICKKRNTFFMHHTTYPY